MTLPRLPPPAGRSLLQGCDSSGLCKFELGATFHTMTLWERQDGESIALGAPTLSLRRLIPTESELGLSLQPRIPTSQQGPFRAEEWSAVLSLHTPLHNGDHALLRMGFSAGLSWCTDRVDDPESPCPHTKVLVGPDLLLSFPLQDEHILASVGIIALPGFDANQFVAVDILLKERALSETALILCWQGLANYSRFANLFADSELGLRDSRGMMLTASVMWRWHDDPAQLILPPNTRAP